ncbi:MAG: phospholipid carrier-dependent glycosyltransferase [Synechococcus sp. SB0673_bin_10]|nr:phospholipid carrier-dependent glycosyltransferase [Synechococcus sp. SB0667_bin_8]MYG63896.1 phospholipid carrier-dependent glycosyltransferase [Synechococcus sp. SB0675_bin_7]MYI71260.1 phospholipid carrier-dependent glycosyltransferase [Synechococcus sp. SB0673_bin_10]MYK84999.1 phospholipid carrier-dependent glycosyltransferase [Synechococcus sp. SB0669_bin_7]
MRKSQTRKRWLVPLLWRWLPLLLIWLLATAADRAWLAADQAIPAWDQADYLNSAVDHGRALGLLPGGEWPGWRDFLLLSPKIPPLASLVHGTVMAVAGEGPDQASWALALWHGLLLLSLDGWGRQLHSPRLAILALVLAAIAPRLVSLRVNFTLDLALTAVTTAALWQLWRWQRPAPHGGHWVAAMLAASGLAAALLVKQSAVPVLAAPYLWAVVTGVGQRQRRRQLLAGTALVLTLLLPWLHQNWITTIGGTHRAVVVSGANEGDPPVFSTASLLYYPQLWWRQLGSVPCIGALLGLGLALWRGLRTRHFSTIPQIPQPSLPAGWGWLLGCTVSGWLLTTMSPNKDARYIAPVLALLILWLSLGWLVLLSALQNWLGRWRAFVLLAVSMALATGHSTVGRVAAIHRAAGSGEPPVVSLVTFLRQHTGHAPTTLLMAPGSADLNEHTGTYYGRLNGGQLLVRSLGDSPAHHPLVLNQAEWVALATGDQGHHRENVRRLSHRIRKDGRFQRVRQWPWSRGRSVELWQRRPDAARGTPFVRQFVVLAQGLAHGPQGLARFMEQIGPHHQLDGHLLYQQQVEAWANRRLAQHPQATDALWSLAALKILRQDAGAADHWLARLEAVLPDNPWPTTWRAAVLLIDWKPWAAREVAHAHPRFQDEPLLKTVGELAAVAAGDLTHLPALHASWPRALEQVNGAL